LLRVGRRARASWRVVARRCCEVASSVAPRFLGGDAGQIAQHQVPCRPGSAKSSGACAGSWISWC